MYLPHLIFSKPNNIFAKAPSTTFYAYQKHVKVQRIDILLTEQKLVERLVAFPQLMVNNRVLGL